MERSKISLFPLVMFIVAAIESVRTLPTTAFFGASLIFYYLLAALIFLIPVALISAEFSSRYSEEGGIFYWVGHAFGERMGFLAVWLQWINTMIWYPTMLLFIAGTASYLIHPALANHTLFLLGCSLFTFWSLTWLNLRGIQISAKINSFCGLIGTLIPIALLIGLGFWWVISGHPIATSFSLEHLLPSWTLWDGSNALVTIMASLLGMELAGVHIGEIENPQRNFPKAILYSVAILLSTLILGSLSIAVVVPSNEIHFVDGVMQTLTTFATHLQIPFLAPLLALLLILGAAGGSVNWLLSPAKGLLQAARKGFLPPFFLVQNKQGVPFRILIGQALLVSMLCIAMQSIPSVNTYYWFLMALSTGIYMGMYILLFLAALKLKKPSIGYQIPTGIRTLACIFGIVGCALTIFIGMLPAPGTALENTTEYGLAISLGFLFVLWPVLLFWRYQKRKSNPKAVSN